MGVRPDNSRKISLVVLAAWAAAAACVDSGRTLHPIARAGSGGDGSVAEAGAPNTGGTGTAPEAGSSSTGDGTARGGTAPSDSGGSAAAGKLEAGGAAGDDTGPVENDPNSVCGNPAACATCSACRDGIVCGREVDACQGDADCDALSGCLNGCTTADCIDHCDGFYGGGRPLLRAALICLACACQDTCPVSGDPCR
jgi:hypothetical protein